MGVTVEAGVVIVALADTEAHLEVWEVTVVPAACPGLWEATVALAEATGVTVEAGVAIVAPVDWEVTAEAMAHLEASEVTVAPREAMEATVAPEAATGVTVEAKAVTVAQADMVAHQEEIVGQVVSPYCPLHTSQRTPFAHIVYTESTKDKLMDKVGGMFGKKDHSSSGDSGDSGSGGYGGDSGSNNY